MISSKLLVFIILVSIFVHCLAHSHSHEHSHSHSHEEHDVLEEKTNPEVQDDAWRNAILASLFISIVPVFILPLLPLSTQPKHSSLLKILLSFAVGGLLGDVFLHLIPHAIAENNHSHSHEGHDHSHEEHDHSHEGHDHWNEIKIGLWVLGGFLTFFLVEIAIRIKNNNSEGHGHSHAQTDAKHKKDDSSVVTNSPKKITQRKDAKKEHEVKGAEEGKGEHFKVAAWLNLVADATHNFTDGLAIGASFLISNPVGITTTIAVFFHEIPHEIGDFAILIQSGFSKKNAMLAQFTTAIGAIAGTICGLLTKDMAESTSWILPFTAGGFIYIATVDVVPELLEKPSFFQSLLHVFALCVGVGMMLVLCIYE